jgi:response regulator RpfG family c-di-GMP phosphodiesterase
MQTYNERLEEALIRIGSIDEAQLLRFIAERCRTQFVSTAKLSRLQVTEDALRLLPERTAEKLLAFPVRYEPDSDTLSIVSPDAGDPEYRKQLTIGIRVRQVKAYVARPAAVRAAIAKWYKGEIQAFGAIAPDTAFQFGTSIEADGTKTDYSAQPVPPLAPPAMAPGFAPRAQLPSIPQTPEFFKTPLPIAPQAGRDAMPLPIPQAPVPATLTLDAPPPPPPLQRAHRSFTPPPAVQVRADAPAAVEISRTRSAPATDLDPASLARTRKPSAPGLRIPQSVPPMSIEVDRRLHDMAELLNVLVTLNENTRDEFRGHSASVAKLSKLLMERMGLDETQQLHAQIAANLHDLGKPVSYHLTLLNTAQYDTHRRAAHKLVYTPQRLVETVGFPSEATTAVSGMYERFDANGFPGRIGGKNITLGARVLSLCDTYSDLTMNPRNMFRKELTHEEAQGVLTKYAGQLFDPDLVELLAQLVVGEDLRRRLSDDKPLVLIVEPDPEEATILELRMVAQGFEVKIARASEQAMKHAQSGNVRFILSEVDLKPFDGFELLNKLRRNEATKNIPFLFVARASDAATVDRAFAMGAQDYVVKPTTGDVLAGKLRRIGQQPKASNDVNAGVAGSLRDLALPDLVQILFHGRKSGRLMVKSQGRGGELHFQDGKIAHALIDSLTGEEAVYEMLGFAEGSFNLDPSFVPTTVTINANPEMVMLEGLRRLDEKNRHL